MRRTRPTSPLRDKIVFEHFARRFGVLKVRVICPKFRVSRIRQVGAKIDMVFLRQLKGPHHSSGSF